jgi:hypothetical protein
MLYAAFGVRSARSGVARAFVVTTPITLGLAAFAGVFFLETERIWVFFTPSMTVIAGRSTVTLWQGSALRDTGAMVLLASALMAWTTALGVTQQVPPSDTLHATIVRKSLEVFPRPPHGAINERPDQPTHRHLPSHHVPRTIRSIHSADPLGSRHAATNQAKRPSSNFDVEDASVSAAYTLRLPTGAIADGSR